jgi:hypothetical protein
VKLVIEGPADWTIDGDNNATLKRGKLVATVPKQAVGFTVVTPTARLVDLGTEFGVRVSDGGSTELLVLRGAVDASQDAPSGKPGDKNATNAGAKNGPKSTKSVHIRIEAGEAIRFEPGQASGTRFAADEKDFARLRRLANDAEDSLDAYAKTILASRPLAYWRLSDGYKEQARDSSGNGHHGRYTGSLQPRQPGVRKTSTNASVRLNGKFTQGSVVIEDLPIGPSFTLELWAKSATPDWNTHAWLASARVPNGFRISPATGGKMWDGRVYDASTTELTSVISEHRPPRIDDRFHFYAVTYDAAADTGRMYFDGEKVGERSPMLNDSKRASSAKITLTLGHDPQTWENRAGDGWIDEPAVFPRALSPDEVRSHYAAGMDTADSKATGSDAAGKATEPSTNN